MEQIQMTSNNNKNTQSKIIEFDVTENLKKLGIKKFILENKDFLVTWSNANQSCPGFYSKKNSLDQNVKKIEKGLKKQIGDKFDDETISLAVRDIEDQIINRRDQIYNLNKITDSTDDSYSEFKSQFLEDVSKLREEFESSSDPFRAWQKEVKKKYDHLKMVTNTCFPDSFQLLEFCLAVKCIQNIYGNDLPFVGFILYKASSLKSTIIDSFQKYPLALYVDDLTKSAFLSHYSTNSEEQLQHDDLIPKMKNKLTLTSEIAPIINTNEDDLRKILGVITRLIDGQGYNSHSGTHGHRSYPPMMFTWIGAGIEIPTKMWTMLSQAGFKLYFFRPTFRKKTVSDLKRIATDDHIPEKKQHLEGTLLEYLKVFDAAPQTENIILDESGNPKIKWDTTRDQDIVINCISNVANLLASLRGIVYTSYSKSRESTKINNNEDDKNKENHETKFLQTEQIEYDIEKSATEDAARAVIQLKKLARGNAITQGRNYLIEEDAKLIITVGFSTTKINRARLIDLLLKNYGELTTSQISKELEMSKPHALQSMQEFDALKIATISTISSYKQSERKIKLNDEYRWFLTDEFKQLYKPTTEITPDIILQTICSKRNSQYVQIITRNALNNQYLGACDTENKNCHTSKVNSNHESNKKNNLLQTEDNNDKKILKDTGYISNETILNENKAEIYNNGSSNESEVKENNNIDNQKNNYSLRVEKPFTHVTLSQADRHTVYKTKQIIPKDVIEKIIQVVKDEKGQIAANLVIELAIQASQVVKEFIKDEKLTSRESRKVRNILVEIVRHPNIEIVKRKPQLVVKWLEKERTT